MSPAVFYAAFTFLIGVLLILGWLYVTALNPKSAKIFGKSILLFVLPGAAITAALFKTHELQIAMWVSVLIEECMKTFAATTEQDRSDRFFLIVLFGIWELILVKPLPGLFQPSAFEDLNLIQIVGLTAGGLVAVLMHAVTAEIYAFVLKKRLALALLVSWSLHVVFDESINTFGVSIFSEFLQFVLLSAIFILFWHKTHQIGRSCEYPA